MKIRPMVNRYARALLAAILVAGIIGCSSSEDRQAKYFAKAQQYFQEGNLEKSRLEVRNVLQINPNHAEARYLWALIHEANQNWRQMYSNLMTAVDLAPEFIEARIKLGQLYYRSEAYDQALEQANAVSGIQPDNTDALTLRGSVFYRRFDNAAAIDEAQKALAIEPGHIGAISIITEVYKSEDPERALAVIGDGIERQTQNATLKLLRISVLEEQGDADGVIAEYKTLIQEFPENLFFHYRLVKYLESEDRIDEAEELLRDIVKTRPDNLQLKLWLAEFIANQRNLALAESTVKEFIENQPNIYELRFALGEIYVALDQFDDAETVYREVIALDIDGADSLKARNAFVKISLGEGDKADAMRLLDEIFEIEKDNSQALITRARIELAEGRAVAAIADLRTVIKNEPNSQEALMLLGNAHEAAGSVDLALDSYKTAVSLNPRNELAMLKIASLSMAEEDYETAKRLLFAVLDTNPSSSEARRLFTALYAQQENWTEATKYAESLENSDTGNQSVLGMYLKSRIQVEQGNCSSALDTLKEVMQLEPNAVEALAQMKDCYVELGLEDEGRRYFLDHVSDNPEHAHAHALLGDLAFAVRDYGTASTAYSQASTLEPAKATHTIGLARALAASGEEEAALDVYEELIESTPGSTDARLYKAELLEALEQYSNAAELYESVLKIDSSNIVASNNLAMILVDHLNSEENIRRAIEITEGFEETDYPALWDTRGWAYYHAAQYTLALALLERVIASPDAQAVFYYHIGMTHYKLGDLDQARMALAKSLGFPSAEFYGRDNARVLVGTI